MKKRILSLILAALIVFSTLSLSSCFLLDYEGLLSSGSSSDSGASGGGSTTINVSGGPTNNITISSASPEVSLAASKAALSSVSIYANFEVYTVNMMGYVTGTEAARSAGSGVIYKLDKEKGDAYIITNYHVVYSYYSTNESKISDDVKVYLYGQDNMALTESGKDKYGIPATFVGGSMNYDIAVLKVTASELIMKSSAVAAQFADSNDVSILDTAIGIGNAKGKGISATLGSVSKPSEYLTMLAADNQSSITLRVIRTDAALNSGNSGGGLFNAKGELIGIVNAKNVEDGVDGISYAIPSNVAKYITENIIYFCDGKDYSYVKRCLIGVTVESVNVRAEYRTEGELSGKVFEVEDVTVIETTEDSKFKDKLIAGDILSSIVIDGKEYKITRRYHVVDALLNARVGSEVTVKYTRGGNEGSATVTVDEAMLVEYK